MSIAQEIINKSATHYETLVHCTLKGKKAEVMAFMDGFFYPLFEFLDGSQIELECDENSVVAVIFFKGIGEQHGKK